MTTASKIQDKKSNPRIITAFEAIFTTTASVPLLAALNTRFQHNNWNSLYNSSIKVYTLNTKLILIFEAASIVIA